MKKKILVIEDNPMVVRTIEFKLTKDGYDVTVAKDGREALSLIKSTQFDLILTDLMLPFISGKELIEYAKENHPNTPIIVLSTSTQEDIITNAFDMGVDDFITKPFSPQELSLRVKRTVKSFHGIT
ncbi:Response regulator receiver domain-containing protein [Zhouia amylolytica]|uniref:Response regulator receiver domain-containing protein n=1 Tax=Zhouia amylolytica TaxID=376730 RepID=A0A1I6V7W4_9FLAO|nr:response regulator transcription factor [Zhouia amylolytica]MCQ0109971.1 response regulator transcription factor [Zhouia amylolytica]SFT09694.1 Response regulator receiver domain-containing protein [Zhouia amylolytica]